VSEIDETNRIDDKAFDRLMSSTDTAMVVVTTAMDGPNGLERAGCLVGFHTQSSIDPPRYCVWLSKANHTYRVALLAQHIAVHFLGSDDLDIAEQFGSATGDVADKFAGWGITDGPSGVPLLDRCHNRLVIRRGTLVDDGGDHVALAGAIVAAEAVGASGFEPLRLSAVTHLDPGHPAEDRPRPPTERAG
jgi:flavin reductase (DIM6/NTAB) family NADH-FMN oxidoreductase RutF